jgi:hypothetical protein
MIEIKFKTKIYNKDGETESNLNRRFNILKAARDCPICIDGKCIGVITDVDTKTDECYGHIFDHDAVIELSQDFKEVVSVEIVNSMR